VGILPLMLATYQRIAIQDADHMGLVQALVSSLMVFIFLVQVVACCVNHKKDLPSYGSLVPFPSPP